MDRLPSMLVVRILYLRRERGMGYRAIAREVGVHWNTVRRYIKLWEESDSSVVGK